jgi:hypothetical protein
MTRSHSLRALLATRVVLLVLLALAAPAAVLAQDPFEIQVYEYETVPKGRWNLETHLNYTGQGTQEPEGPMAPTDNQFHMTYELTRGITKNFEMAGYLVLAHRSEMSGPLEFAGWRLRPRISAPTSWNLPVGLSFSAEVGFPQEQYEENSVTLELRPIIERKLGRFQIDVNPVIGKALSGPGSSEGWDFEPGVRLGFEATPRLDLSLEYYGSTGPLNDFLPSDEQVHQFFPGGDFKITPDVILNFGVGFAATDAGNDLVYKMRIGWMFGREQK